MDNLQNSNTEKDRRNKEIVDKIASGKQASYNDEPLTPPRKIEAEQQRMRNQGQNNQEVRQEEDKQFANLGGAILTPQRKMDRARQEMADRDKEKGAF